MTSLYTEQQMIFFPVKDKIIILGNNANNYQGILHAYMKIMKDMQRKTAPIGQCIPDYSHSLTKLGQPV